MVVLILLFLVVLLPILLYGTMVSLLKNISNLDVGLYSVSVTDSLGCNFDLDSIAISQPTELTAVLSATDDLGGTCTGSVDATPAGGATSYTYLWNDSAFSTSASVTNLCEGMYTVTITDANGCQFVDSVLVLGDSTSTISTANFESDFQLFPNPVQNQLNLDWNQIPTKVAIRITDMLGREMYIESFESIDFLSLDVSNWSAGKYIVSIIYDNNTIENTSFVKE